METKEFASQKEMTTNEATVVQKLIPFCSATNSFQARLKNSKQRQKLTRLRDPSFPKKPVVVAKVQWRRGRLLRPELELHDVRGSRLDPDAAVVRVTAEMQKLLDKLRHEKQAR